MLDQKKPRESDTKKQKTIVLRSSLGYIHALCYRELLDTRWSFVTAFCWESGLCRCNLQD